MLKVSERAKTKIVDLLIEEKSKYIRAGLQGGGCHGFQYFFAIEESKSEDDYEIDIGDGYFLLIDSMSMMYLNEAEIDYKKELMGESFLFHNPNVKTECGCGSSVTFE